MSKYAPHAPSSNNPRASASTLCQKCLKKGHFTYQCKNERPYVSRPSRTQQLEKPKLLQRLRAEGKPSVEVPEEFKKKSGTANKILEGKEKEREAAKEIEGRKRKRSKSSDSSNSDSDSGSGSESESESGSSSSSDSDSQSSFRSHSSSRAHRHRRPRRRRSSSVESSSSRSSSGRRR